MDNLAFMPDNEGQKQKDPTTTSYELRNAWQKLYMQEPSSHSAREDRQSLNHSAREERQSLNHSLVEDRSNNRRTPTVEDNPTFQNGLVSNSQHLTYHPNHPISNTVTSQHNVRPASTVPGAANNVRRPSIGSLTASKAPASTHNTISKSEFPYGSTHSLTQHHIVQGRESPTGQSPTHPDQLAINTSSHLSSYPSANRNLSTFKPEKDKPAVTSEPAIGPAAKYPESTMSRRSSGSVTPLPQNNQHHRHNIPSPQFPLSLRQHRSESTNSFDTIEFNVGDKPPRPMSRLHTKGTNFLDSEDDLGDDYTLQPLDSIFDYPDAISQDGSETPPLQPLSPNLTPRGSNSSTPRFNYLPKQTDVQKSPPKTPDLLRSGSQNPLKTGVTLRNNENKEHLSQFKYQHQEDKDFLQKSGLPIKAKGKQLLSEYSRFLTVHLVVLW
ncbi:uncharacterized protein LOC131944979 [Physella acuta]|uniref:uncharacterized protein LOC131944979 n=1 Tax=Physella acuta TaxID=109671 RepID=UPI0027DDE48C|nr:uncharacterized protein LOC131944979 [Physella acuta]